MNGVHIANTTMRDWEMVMQFFEGAIKLQGQNNYKVWDSIDLKGLENDIQHNLQYKVIVGETVVCIFSVQFSDPYIWRGRDRNDAIYLHRIVVNPLFKGQKLFLKILTWATEIALQKNRSFVRMDTWADNHKIIDYYKSFGFKFIENYKTPDTDELPIQNRNLNVALLEKKVG
jgi:ribosomal protein S18 acetylase RimI-like enzyme